MIKLKEILTQEIPEYFYHATFKQLLPSIQKYGLNPNKIAIKMWRYSKSDRIYLVDNPEFAVDYVKNSDSLDIPDNWFNEIIIFRIQSSNLEISKLHDDANINLTDDIVICEYHGIIPWNIIELYHD